MKIDIQRVLGFCICAGLVLTPFVSLGEVLALISGRLAGLSVLQTPFFIKVLKDAIFLLLLSLVFMHILYSGKMNAITLALMVLAIPFITVLLILGYQKSPYLPLAGLRWFMPVLLATFLIGYIDEAIMRRVAKTLIFVLIIHLSFQVYEMMFMSRWFGQHPFFPGAAARVPGIFVIPSAAAFLSILTFFYAYFFGKKNIWRYLYLFLAVFSIFLSMSGTGLAALLAIIFALLPNAKYRRVAIVIFLPVLVGFIASTLGALSGRGEYMWLSLLERIKVWSHIVGDLELISTSFGTGTVSGHTLVQALNVKLDLIIVDSTYVGIIVNIGLLGSIVFMVLFFFWLYAMYNLGRLDLICFTILFGMFGLTTPITEFYPASLLFSVGFAYYIVPICGYLLKMARPLREEGACEAGTVGQI